MWMSEKATRNHTNNYSPSHSSIHAHTNQSDKHTILIYPVILFHPPPTPAELLPTRPIFMFISLFESYKTLDKFLRESMYKHFCVKKCIHVLCENILKSLLK